MSRLGGTLTDILRQLETATNNRSHHRVSNFWATEERLKNAATTLC